MTVVLYRVDERLIHGQVVIGWGGQLRPDRYVVVDDHLAGSEWEQELYRLGLPDKAEGQFLSVEGARRALGGFEMSSERVVVLTRDVETMLRLARGGMLRGEKVNLGGIHHAPGRERVRPYLYLDAAERGRILGLVEEGADVSGRDVPAAVRVDLDTLLGRR